MTARHLGILQRLLTAQGRREVQFVCGGPGAGAAHLLSRDLDPAGSGDVPDPWYGGHQTSTALEVIERVTLTIIALARWERRRARGDALRHEPMHEAVVARVGMRSRIGCGARG